jgi:hypothetical protein
MEQEYLSRPRFSAVVKIISTPNPHILLSPKTVITDTVQYLNSLLLCQGEAFTYFGQQMGGEGGASAKKGWSSVLILVLWG